MNLILILWDQEALHVRSTPSSVTRVFILAQCRKWIPAVWCVCASCFVPNSDSDYVRNETWWGMLLFSCDSTPRCECVSECAYHSRCIPSLRPVFMDRLRLYHNPVQDKALTENNWMNELTRSASLVAWHAGSVAERFWVPRHPLIMDCGRSNAVESISWHH